jgi:hypothetical protein
VHEGGFTLEHAGPGYFRIFRSDGRPVPAVLRSAAATGQDLRAQNRARGLQIDADTCMPLSAGDRIDYGLASELFFRE